MRDAPVILVLGNEGAGISKEVLAACEDNVVISQFVSHQKQKGRVRSTRYKDTDDDDDIESTSLNESLNVGVATGILLHSVTC